MFAEQNFGGGKVGRTRRDVSAIIILGPTGSGKTGVSTEIAKAVGGEIISADSRAIYKGMDIGTAKPTTEEMDGVPHYGIDLVEPGEIIEVDAKADEGYEIGNQTIKTIWNRNFARAAECRSQMKSSAPMPTARRMRITACTATRTGSFCRNARWMK